MTRLFSMILTVAFVVTAGMASAQDRFWVQVAAFPSLATAEAQVQSYGDLGNVNGYTLNTGWYAVALGPYTEREAQTALNRLLASGRIPQDSYLVNGAAFRQQFLPLDAGAEQATPVTVTQAEPAPAPEPAAPPPADETRAEARQSERALTEQDRKDLQIALAWDGFYNSGIDGAFGPGTRNAMAAWQSSRSFDATGVLTTRQRAQLIGEYRAVFEGLGLETVRNTEAGIAITLPAAMVSFTRFEPPFVHYEGDDVRVLLISQEGTPATLAGLYDIMQSLEIVPLSGERSLSRESFTLRGNNSEISSYTYAAHGNGHVKGFTLVWPAGDSRRFERVVQEMRDSFDVLPGVLDDTLGAPSGEQRIDLLAGLEIRKPDVSRSGFFVDSAGSVLTSLDVVRNCSRFTLDTDYDAQVVATSDALGLALLQPLQSLRPVAVAEFDSGTPRLQSELAVSGFSYEGALGAPTLTFGTLSDVRGLNGEDGIKRLAMTALPGDAGGPVLEPTGAVLGALLARETGARQLPGDVSFAASYAPIAEFLSSQEITPLLSERTGALPGQDLTEMAANMTVLVSCWN